MSTITYIFHEGGGTVIPGIPRDEGGEGHAGMERDVDIDTNTVVATRIGGQEMPSGQPLTVRIQAMDGQHIASGTVDEMLQPAAQDYTTQPLVEEQPLANDQLPFPNETVQPEPVAAPEQPVEVNQ